MTEITSLETSQILMVLPEETMTEARKQVRTVSTEQGLLSHLNITRKAMMRMSSCDSFKKNSNY